MNETLYSWTVEHLNFTSSAATEFRYGGRFYFTVFRSLFTNPKVKELLKSVHICQSSRKNKSGTFLWPTVYKSETHTNSMVVICISDSKWSDPWNEFEMNNTVVICNNSSVSSSSKWMLDLVEDLSSQLWAERDNKFRVLLLVSLVANDIQPGQSLDISERNPM